MLRKIGIIVIVLGIIVISFFVVSEFLAKNKIIRNIENFYGTDIEIVSVERNFKLSEKEHVHYDVLAKTKNSDIAFSINADTMLNDYTRTYWNTWMQKQATLLIQNNFSENAYCSKVILLGESLLDNPAQKIMDYEEYMTNHVGFDTVVVYKIQDKFSDVEEQVHQFLVVLVNSGLKFDTVSLVFDDGAELRYSYEEIASM